MLQKRTSAPASRRPSSTSPDSSDQASAARMLPFSSSSRSSQAAWLGAGQLRLGRLGELEEARRGAGRARPRARRARRAARARTRGSSRASRSAARRRRSRPGGRGSCRRARRRRRAPRRTRARAARRRPPRRSRASMPPTKTPSRANERLAAVVEQVVAPVDRVAERRPAPLAAAGEQRRAARSSRPTIASGVSSFTRAAASSIASGMPSSRRQISATASAFSSVSSKLGLAACARSTKSCDGGASRPSPSPRRRARASGGTGVLALAAHAQRRPARHEHLQPRRGREQLGDERRRRQHLLEVVEHEQRRLVAEALARSPSTSGRLGVSRTPSSSAIAVPTSSGPAPATRSTKYASVELVLRASRGLEREPRLAGAAEPGQRDEPHGRPPSSARPPASSASRPTSGVASTGRFERVRRAAGAASLEQRAAPRGAAPAGRRARRAPPRRSRGRSRTARPASFAIARAITASSAAGRSGRTSVTAGGGSRMCANMTATSVSRSYGFLPGQASKSTQPNA